jgi:hypothetical protein
VIRPYLKAEGDVLSPAVLLNKVLVKMQGNNFPKIKPIIKKVKTTKPEVTLPPLAMGFFVLNDVQAPACMGSDAQTERDARFIP